MRPNAGTIWLFMLVPKTFLPPGDSGVIFGAFIAREGSSPEQMRAYQDRVDEILGKAVTEKGVLRIAADGSGEPEVILTGRVPCLAWSCAKIC